MPNISNDISYVPEGFEKATVRLSEGSSQPRANLASRSYPERYGLLESALAEAVKQDVISPLPTSKPAHKSAYSDSRLKTIRKRLYMLGYLERDSGQANLGSTLEAATIRFQQEAKLAVTDFSVDGWVGEETWTALQELVSFEEPTRLQRWFVRDQPVPALKRAVQLRLFAFGLCPMHPKDGPPDDAAMHAGLKAFAGVAAWFHWRDQPVLASACFDTLHLLMDQDELALLLAKSNPISEAVGRKPEKTNPLPLDIACRFVINFTKAELWMLGYEHVAPCGYQTADIRQTVDSGYELRGGLFKAMKRFWTDRKDNAHATMKAKQYVIKYFPMFFSAIHQAISDAAGETQHDSDLLFRQLKEGAARESEKNLIQKVWHELRTIGSRIWDGLKRAWHWLTSIAKKGVTWLKNLTRLAYNYILKSFEAARTVVSGVAGSLAFFAHRELRFPWRGLGVEPARPVLRMGRDSDFDFRTVVNEAADAVALERVATYLESKSSIFAMSCRMFAALLELVIDLIKHTVFSGWAVLLMALLKLYKVIKAFAPQILAFARTERRMLAVEAG